MSRYVSVSHPEVKKKVGELRRHLGLFSFQDNLAGAETGVQAGLGPELGIRPGTIVEWLTAGPGAGGMTAAVRIMARSRIGVWAVVDRGLDCYFPAFTGWGVDPSGVLVLRPVTDRETWWGIEQCLRCRGISSVWAWVDERVPDRVCRRWQLAAEVGGSVGLFFRPVCARRQPVWADLRLLVKTRAGGEGENRRMRIDVLYRRGGVGGLAQAWEIDHGAGHVRLVSEVADPEIADCEARA